MSGQRNRWTEAADAALFQSLEDLAHLRPARGRPAAPGLQVTGPDWWTMVACRVNMASGLQVTGPACAKRARRRVSRHHYKRKETTAGAPNNLTATQPAELVYDQSPLSLLHQEVKGLRSDLKSHLASLEGALIRLIQVQAGNESIRDHYRYQQRRPTTTTTGE